MKRYFFIILIPLIMFSSTSLAKTMYITDSFKIMVRRYPGEEYKIVAQLPSNEKVDILEIKEAWAKISFSDKTGRVLKRFLTEETPKQIQITELERKVKDQAGKIDDIEKENISLKQKNAEIGERVNQLSLENQSLKVKPYGVMMLLSGGGIFLIGCIMTLIIQRLRGGRRSGRLSF